MGISKRIKDNKGHGERPATKVRAQLYTGWSGSCVLPKASGGTPDDFRKKDAKTSQGKHILPCDGGAVYPFEICSLYFDDIAIIYGYFIRIRYSLGVIPYFFLNSLKKISGE